MGMRPTHMSFMAWLKRIFGELAKSPTFPAPVPPPAPVPEKEIKPMAERTIAGGKAHITGIHEKGPQGPALKGERLREVRDRGDNAPEDCWIATGFTPVDQDGKEFGPMPASEVSKHPQPQDQTNPEMEGVPAWDDESNTSGTSGDHQVARLEVDKSGLTAGDAEVVHEYADHGCVGRVKCVGARGTLGLSYKYNGGSVPLNPPTVNVGRQEAKGEGDSAGAIGGKHK